MTTIAAAANSGVDPHQIATYPLDSDHWHTWTAIAREAITQQQQRDQALADRIANAVADRIADLLPWVKKRKA